MSTGGTGRTREFGPFALLLGALVLSMMLAPVVERGALGDLLIRIGFTVVLAAGIGIARQNRFVLALALVLVGANVIVNWIIGDREGVGVMENIFGAAYLGYLVVVLVWTLSKRTDTTLDVVLGGINVYLLLALCFLHMHMAIEQLVPGSYQRAGLALSHPDNLLYGRLSTSFFYFSFSTITTLGYGDITPTRPAAQVLCSAEAVIGQLYVAIFIGGLVALRISERQK